MLEKEVFLPYLEYTDAESRRKIKRFTFSMALRMLGSPQNGLKFVHVTGTNGKGSTCALIASILQKAGYKVGLFCSPHISSFTERIQVDFTPIPLEDFQRLQKKVYGAYKRLVDLPDLNVVYTAAALLYFREMNCDIVVLETGIGGKNDATNVILNTEAAVITNMGLDHTNILGNTVEAITANKSYIIKPGCDVVLYPSFDSVERIIGAAAIKNDVDLHVADFSKLAVKKNDVWGQLIDYKDRKDIQLPLLGEYQPNNAALVLEVIDVLKSRGWDIAECDIYEGIRDVKWPCRMEILHRDPYIVADGAHNPQGLEILFKSLDDYFPGKKIHVIFGCMRDKDYSEMLSMLKDRIERLYFVQCEGVRPLNTQELCRMFNEKGGKAVACGSVDEAVNLCRQNMEPDDLMVGTGTFRLMADLKTKINSIYN